MDCKEAKTRFLDLHEGELGDEDLLAVETHLKDCAKCRSEWEDYGKTMEELSGMHRLAPAQDFVSRVKHTIGHRSRGRFFGQSETFNLGFAIVSFVLILLFLLAYLFISTGNEIRFIGHDKRSSSPRSNAEDRASGGREAPADRPLEQESSNP